MNTLDVSLAIKEIEAALICCNWFGLSDEIKVLRKRLMTALIALNVDSRRCVCDCNCCRNRREKIWPHQF